MPVSAGILLSHTSGRNCLGRAASRELRYGGTRLRFGNLRTQRKWHSAFNGPPVASICFGTSPDFGSVHLNSTPVLELPRCLERPAIKYDHGNGPRSDRPLFTASDQAFGIGRATSQTSRAKSQRRRWRISYETR